MAAAAEQPFGPWPFARMAASSLVYVSTYILLALPCPAGKGPTARPRGMASTGPLGAPPRGGSISPDIIACPSREVSLCRGNAGERQAAVLGKFSLAAIVSRAIRRARLGYDRRVPRPSFSPISLLRYAGLITYACVGVPLVQRDWMLSSLSEPRTPVHVARALHAQNHTDILLWAASYVIFGVVYWLLTRNLGSRRYWGIRLLGLLVLTCAALAICWFSASGVGALLLMVVGLVLPWLLPLPVAIAWLVLQNVACIPVYAAFPNFTMAAAVLQ